MVSRRGFLAAGAAALLPRFARAAQDVDALHFSALAPGAPLPADYRTFAFSGVPRTQFTAIADDGRTVLRARADASMAAIVRTVNIPSARRPELEWRWKVLQLPAHGNLATREGDDFAARLYVAFNLPLGALPLGTRVGVWLARLAYGNDVPAAALCYVWAAGSPAGTIAPSAFTDRVQMVVVDSGADGVGQWRTYRRDVVADYERAFGAPAPAISGVAVACDADNTGSRAEAWFGDVRFTARPPS